MKTKFDVLVPGAGKTNDEIGVVAPYDGEVIGSVASAGSSAVERALQTAYRLYRDRDNWLKPHRRIEILEKTAQLMSARAEKLAVEAAREGGKPLVDSRVEVARAIDGVRNAIETLRTQSGKEIPMNLNPASENRLAVTRKEPIGVVVAVSAFNHPLNLIIHQVVPAIAVGCPVIVKPATDTPLSCMRFVELLREANLPAEWCQALLPRDKEITTRLVTDGRVAFLSFIGSAEVGWKLRSKLAPGTRCALEHGGVAPVIVAEDANLDNAIPLITKAGLYHAGQVCVSVQKVFAHKSIFDEVTARLSKSAAKLKIGDPTLPETEVGPLIRSAEVDRVEAWVNEAIAQGAGLKTGGHRLSDATYECTVLANPGPDSKVSRQEIFGPVIAVYAYSDIDDAISQANSLPFAFQAAIFTQDIDTAMRGYSRLDAAAVMVNDHTAFRVDWMPFAGLKHSGLAIGGIPYTMHDMQVEKMLVVRSKAL